MPVSTAVHCGACDTSYPDWNSFYSHETMCDACGAEFCPSIDTHCQTCCECDSEYICGDVHYCDSDNDDNERDSEGVFNYSYTPRLDFRGTGDYHLGVELEISAERGATPVYDWARDNSQHNLFYCKEDGSVEGFEIVTHPMTPAYFESVDWEGFFAMLNETYPTNRAGNREPSGHGIHVHVSRTAFHSPLTLARWSYLLNRHSDDVERVARRSGSQWARFTERPVGEVLAREGQRRSVSAPCQPSRFTDVPIWLCGRTSGDNWDAGECNSMHPYDTPEHERYGRYCSVMRYEREENPAYLEWQRGSKKHDWNATLLRNASHRPERYRVLNMQNEHTVEARVFRSTRRASEFRDSVRLVYTSVEYVRSMQAWHATHSGTRASLTWTAYVAYVLAQYAELYPTVAGMNAGNPDRTPRNRDELGRFAALRDGAFTPAA